MTKKYFLILMTLFAFFCTKEVKAQLVSIKTNIVMDATSTVNLGVEVGLAPRWSIEIAGGYNGWDLNGKQIKNWYVQPEARYWFCDKKGGHFVGLHAHYAEFNMGGMLPFWYSPEWIKHERFEGDLYGVGLTYGYQWALTQRLSVEASIGGGYAYIDYDKYELPVCGQSLGSGVEHYIGITKLGVNFIVHLW